MENESQFILEKVRATIATLKKYMPPSYTAGGPPHTYLPSGEHLIRPVLDPTGELFRLLRVHHNRGGMWRTHCPNAMQQYGPPGAYPSCALCDLAIQRDDREMRMKVETLMYGHVYATEPPSKYRKPGQTYLLVLMATLAETIRAHLDTWLDTQPEAVCAMLTPHSTGPAIMIRVTPRPRWSLTLSLTAVTYPPIALGDWYRPLTECWIGTEFNLTEYHAVLAALKGAA